MAKYLQNGSMSTQIAQHVSEITHRIKIAYDISTDAELSRFLNVSTSTLANWKKRNSINYDLIFAKCTDLNLDWLIRGEGQSRNNSVSETVGEYMVTKIHSGDIEDMTLVSVYNDILSAGSGRDAEIAEVVAQMGFMATWLRHEAHVDPERVFVAMIRGDSMADLLLDGDLVLVERVEEIDNDGVFVVWRHDDVRVKHVQKNGSSIRLISHNPTYPPVEMEAPGPEEFGVIGRVVRRIVRV